MSDLSDPTALPTEPGHYLDKDGGYWHLNDGGSLFDPADFETQSNGDPAQYAPFTRLFPAAHFAAELDGLRAQVELIREQVERPFTESLDIGKEIGEILAQSPRGTVARIDPNSEIPAGEMYRLASEYLLASGLVKDNGDDSLSPEQRDARKRVDAALAEMTNRVDRLAVIREVIEWFDEHGDPSWGSCAEAREHFGVAPVEENNK